MTATKKTKTDYNIPPIEFIRIWHTSSSTEEVSQRTGMPKPIVLARVSQYRLQGIKMKKMPRESHRRLDVDALNQMIDELAPEGEEKTSPTNIDVPAYMLELVKSTRG